MHILALDIGTSSVKAAVLDVATASPVGAIAHVAYELDHPQPEAAVLDPDRLWAAVIDAAREAARPADAVQGLGISCLTPGLVLLDRGDHPVVPIVTHLDRRS